MDDGIAACMRGTYLLQMHPLVADLHVECAFERTRRQRVGHAIELKGAEAVQKELSQLAHVGGAPHQRGHHLG
jgi:hypothetical protein